ncbi:unnamed protein product [Soboliphyme baturini]|uniref:Activin_recp domain-containing protein n=1 Tax=Soboliphyme baturini TaxID=241478 RepID=A0A183I8T4_9BILA|nr:unnamed protein product [Soboliphyme baturini]
MSIVRYGSGTVNDDKYESYAIQCYQCNNQSGSCNVGECTGLACIMIEAVTANRKKSVRKGCTQIIDRPRCVRADITGIEAIQCICNTQFCNGDDELVRNGLRQEEPNVAVAVTAASADRSKRTSFGVGGSGSQFSATLSGNSIAMLILICLFITGSFTLLIFNTWCAASFICILHMQTVV